MARHEPKKMVSSYQQVPDNASSQEATSDLDIARMNLGAPADTMMRSLTLPVRAGGRRSVGLEMSRLKRLSFSGMSMTAEAGKATILAPSHGIFNSPLMKARVMIKNVDLLLLSTGLYHR